MSFMKFFLVIAILAPGASQAFSQESSESSSDEGFFENADALPPATLPAWRATFAIAVLGAGQLGEGSTFLVGTEGQGTTKKFYFLTNAHVIGSFCELNKPCGAVIARNFICKDSFLNMISSQNLNTFTPQLIKIDVKNDLALLEATFDGNGDIIHGNSGGPLVNEQGLVIGVNTRT